MPVSYSPTMGPGETFITSSGGTYHVTSSSSATCATGDVWRVWSETSGAITIETAWTTWATGERVAHTIRIDPTSTWVDWSRTHHREREAYEERTAEARARYEAQELARAEELRRSQAEFEERQRVAAAARAKADEVAEVLLLENLDEAQAAEYRLGKSFMVRGSAGGVYRIRRGRSANIDVVDKAGVVVRRLCVHPSEAVPDCDTMLAQKLLLEACEEMLIATANKHAAPGGVSVTVPERMRESA